MKAYIKNIRVLIQNLALTNIFLDNTAALRKKYLHPSCSLIFLFLFCWNKVYTFRWLFLIIHMLLQHWPTICLALPGESVMLHYDSRPLCTASWSVCKMQPMLGTFISSTALFIFFMLSRKMTWTCCLSFFVLSFTHVQHLLTCLFYMLCCMRST